MALTGPRGLTAEPGEYADPALPTLRGEERIFGCIAVIADPWEAEGSVAADPWGAEGSVTAGMLETSAAAVAVETTAGDLCVPNGIAGGSIVTGSGRSKELESEG